MRERLIELFNRKICGYMPCKGDCRKCDGIDLSDGTIEALADYLLAEGVIVPPCKVGDTVYRIVGANSLTPYVYDWEIVEIRVYQDEIVCIDDSGNPVFVDEIGKTVFLAKETAEEALKNEQEEL